MRSDTPVSQILSLFLHPRGGPSQPDSPSFFLFPLHSPSLSLSLSSTLRSDNTTYYQQLVRRTVHTRLRTHPPVCSLSSFVSSLSPPIRRTDLPATWRETRHVVLMASILEQRTPTRGVVVLRRPTPPGPSERRDRSRLVSSKRTFRGDYFPFENGDGFFDLTRAGNGNFESGRDFMRSTLPNRRLHSSFTNYERINESYCQIILSSYTLKNIYCKLIAHMS